MEIDEERLISVVRQYPELYDLENKHYANQNRKYNIWSEIGVDFGLTGSACKDKWKALRDSYNRSIKRRKTKSGDSAKNDMKWRLESQMEFLRPFIQERCSKTNIKSPVVVNSEDDIYTSITDEIYPDEVNYTEPIHSPSSTSTTAPATFSMTREVTKRKKNQTSKKQGSQVADILEKYLEKRPNPMTSSMESTNPIHSFFKAMADSVVNLSPALQLQVKNKVFATVYESMSQRQTTLSRCIPTPKPQTVIHQEDDTMVDVHEQSQSILPQKQYYINSDGLMYSQEIIINSKEQEE